MTGLQSPEAFGKRQSLKTSKETRQFNVADENRNQQLFRVIPVRLQNHAPFEFLIFGRRRVTSDKHDHRIGRPDRRLRRFLPVQIGLEISCPIGHGKIMTAKFFDEAPRRRVIAPGERYKNIFYVTHGITSGLSFCTVNSL